MYACKRYELKHSFLFVCSAGPAVAWYAISINKYLNNYYLVTYLLTYLLNNTQSPITLLY